MRDGAPIFIALSDLLICLLCYVLIAVAPSKAKTDGIHPKAEFLVSADWPVSLDSDVDLWLVGPDRKPVFYGSRLVACASLDQDSLGNSTSLVTLVDDTQVRADSNKETTTIRCLAHGHWDVAVNLYSDRELAKGALRIPVHVEIVGLNPSVRTLFSADVALDRDGQTINVVSFDLDSEGHVKLVSPPLEPLTDSYRKGTP